MSVEGTAVPDTSGGDVGGGADTGGAPAEGSGGAGPSQVIPKLRGEGDDAGADDGAPANDNAKAPRAPKPTKHKIKYFGQEREIASLDDVLPMLSDDYELEIPVSGEKRKAKYPDLVRGYQLSEGAFDRMRKAAELEKGVNGRLEHGRKDPMWGLEMMLGVQDPIRWAAEVVRNQMQLEKELDELYNTDRFEWQRRMDKLADERKSRREAYESEQRRAAEEGKARKEAAERTEREVREACEKVGLKWGPATRTIAGEIFAKYAAVGHQLNPADVAAMAREEYIRQVNEFIDSHDDEGLVKFLGDQRRKKLRQYELNEVRKGGKQQPAQQQPATNGARKPEPQKGMTEKEYREQFRRG